MEPSKAPTWPLVPATGNRAETPPPQPPPHAVHTQRGLPHIRSTRVGHPTHVPPACCGVLSETTTRCCGFGLDSPIPAYYSRSLRNTAHSKAPDRRRDPAPTHGSTDRESLHRPKHAEGFIVIMARSSAPAKPVANGHSTTENGNGHATNGNGNGNGNGHGGHATKKERASGYCQLTPGQKPTWKGLTDRAPIHPTRRPPVRHRRVGPPRGGDHERARQDRVRAEGPRVPEELVRPGHQRRRQQVLPRPPRHAGARAHRQADDRPRRRHDRGLGHQGRLLRDR